MTKEEFKATKESFKKEIAAEIKKNPYQNSVTRRELLLSNGLPVIDYYLNLHEGAIIETIAQLKTSNLNVA